MNDVNMDQERVVAEQAVESTWSLGEAAYQVHVSYGDYRLLTGVIVALPGGALAVLGRIDSHWMAVPIADWSDNPKSRHKPWYKTVKDAIQPHLKELEKKHAEMEGLKRLESSL